MTNGQQTGIGNVDAPDPYPYPNPNYREKACCDS